MTTNNLTAHDEYEDGKLAAIEYRYENGDFAFRAVWDPNDEHTEENIEAFRKWCGLMATRLGYVIINKE